MWCVLQVDINYFDFGKDVYDTLEVAPVISSITVNTLSKAGEDTKIQAYGKSNTPFICYLVFVLCVFIFTCSWD